MEGELDAVIEPLVQEHQADQLAALGAATPGATTLGAKSLGAKSLGAKGA
jgi:hypothetical protein